MVGHCATAVFEVVVKAVRDGRAAGGCTTADKPKWDSLGNTKCGCLYLQSQARLIRDGDGLPRPERALEQRERFGKNWNLQVSSPMMAGLNDLKLGFAS